MKEFNNIKEIDKYYNEDTNTYEFVENGERLDVKFNFNLKTNADIYALNIDADNIDTWNIDAWNIDADNIDADNIDALNIDALNIDALNIDAWNIDADNIRYYAVCFAYKNISCKSIKGKRCNSKHFCLDGKIKIKENNNEKK